MPLENMKSMSNKAATEKYAVGAFNMLDYNSTKAVVAAAEQLNAPVIIQTSAKTVIFGGGGNYNGLGDRSCRFFKSSCRFTF